VGNICLESQEKQYLDGNAWNSYSLEEKYTFIDGYKTGVRRVYQIIEEISDIQQKTQEATQDEYWKKAFEYLSKLIVLDVMNITDFDQILEGVDTFYKDYANRHINLYHAFLIVERRVRGLPEKKIEELIEKYRRLDIKRYKNKESKKEKERSKKN
jgi:hypothetical protein